MRTAVYALKMGKIGKDPRLMPEHQDGFPGVHCPGCNEKWAKTGISYPSLKCPPELIRLSKKLGWNYNIPLREYKKLAAQLEDQLEGRPISPGTHVGPLQMSVAGEVDDFNWCGFSTLITEEAKHRIEAAWGARIPGQYAKVKSRKTAVPPLFEIEAWPTLRMSRRDVTIACSICGRPSFELTKELKFVKSSIRRDVFAQRGSELSAYMFVRQEIAELIMSLGLSNVEFEPYDAVDEE